MHTQSSSKGQHDVFHTATSCYDLFTRTSHSTLTYATKCVPHASCSCRRFFFFCTLHPNLSLAPVKTHLRLGGCTLHESRRPPVRPVRVLRDLLAYFPCHFHLVSMTEGSPGAMLKESPATHLVLTVVVRFPLAEPQEYWLCW